MIDVCTGPGMGGHNIASLKKEEGVDPSSKQVVSSCVVICSKCGMTLEEIRAATPKTRRRKPKVSTEDVKNLD